MSRRSWACRFVIFMAGIVAAGLLERWVITGLLVPVRVVSGSMAPHLKGPHGHTVCDDCQFRFVWDAATVHADSSRVCPNCGAIQQSESATWHRGDRVLIWRAAYRPRRWDAVVVNLPRKAARLPTGATGDRWTVKRIVGLPGEQIALRHGEVWVGHKHLQKDWSAQRRLSLLVHDDTYRTRGAAEAHSERWCGHPDGTRWKATPLGYRWRAPELGTTRPPASSQDWLTYQHRACFDSPLARRDKYPMRDHHGYNQSLSRPLHEISDLFVHFRCRLQGPQRSPRTALQIRVHEGHGTLHLQWNGEGPCEVTHDDGFRFTAKLPSLPVNQWFQVVAGIWDGQVVMVIDDVERMRTDYRAMSHPWRPSSRPIAIGADGWRQVDLTDVSVWRDTYFTHPHDLAGGWELESPLGPDEYLLLGDNSPASLDGRHGRQHGIIRRKAILGGVFPQPNGF